jgi:hypothetical protein
MGMEEDLARRCRELEDALRHYATELKKRDAEIARLRQVLGPLARRYQDEKALETVVTLPEEPEPEPAQAVEKAADTPPAEEVASEPTDTPAAEMTEPEESPAPARTGAESGEEEPPDAAGYRAVALPQGHPLPHVPPTSKPGQFLMAVLDGEDEADEVLDLLERHDASPPADRHRVIESLSTLHHLMTNKMVMRMDPGLAREKRLFIRYGMLDERFMADRMNVWEALLADHTEPGTSGVYFMDEWFDAVGRGEVHFSSIDEIALGGGKADRAATGQTALSYEIVNGGQMQRMCVGPRGVKASILCQAWCSPGRDNPVVNREWIAEALAYARKCDTALFQRHYRGQDVEVQPLVIISPGYGERGVCWEPYSPGHKGDTGPRLCLCAFPPRGGMRAVFMALADYKWEYSKADARQYWMTEGITGDWMSLFTSAELKHDPKSRFIEAYIQWGLKESQRIPTLEKRLREFFWRKAPFDQTIKENVRGSGVYSHLFELDERIREREAFEG